MWVQLFEESERHTFTSLRSFSVFLHFPLGFLGPSKEMRTSSAFGMPPHLEDGQK